MRDSIWESGNTVLGYLGLGIFFTSILVYFDGRIGLLSMFFYAFTGLFLNAAATVSELYRSDDSREWLRKTMNEAMIGNHRKALKLLREGEL